MQFAVDRVVEFAGAALLAPFAKGAGSGSFRLRNRLERRYRHHHLHFMARSCYRRILLLGRARKRDRFLKVLDEVRTHYNFSLAGYVLMPEQTHRSNRAPEAQHKLAPPGRAG